MLNFSAHSNSLAQTDTQIHQAAASAASAASAAEAASTALARRTFSLVPGQLLRHLSDSNSTDQEDPNAPLIEVVSGSLRRVSLFCDESSQPPSDHLGLGVQHAARCLFSSLSSGQPAALQQDEDFSARRFSGVSVVDSRNLSLSETPRALPQVPPLLSRTYEYEKWELQHPGYPTLVEQFSTTVRTPGPEKSVRHMDLEYAVSAFPDYRRPYHFDRNTQRMIPIRALRDDEVSPVVIKSWIDEQNRRLLCEAQADRILELPSAEDPATTQDLVAIQTGAELQLCYANNLPTIAIAAAKGKRSSMQDAYAAGAFDFQKRPIKFVAVFDGHNDVSAGMGGGGALSIDYGASAASFCADSLAFYVGQRLAVEMAESRNSCKDPTILDALTLAFVDLSQSYSISYPSSDIVHPRKGGSTATAAFMIGNRLWVAGVGDSPAFLVGPSGERVALTVDAHPHKKRLHREVLARGGKVDATSSRVGEGACGIAIARTIGDHRVKGVSARADVVFKNCPEGGWGGWHLVIMSDGINEKNKDGTAVAVSTREVSQIIHDGVQAGKDLLNIAEDITTKALIRGSTDNMTLTITPVASLL